MATHKHFDVNSMLAMMERKHKMAMRNVRASMSQSIQPALTKAVEYSSTETVSMTELRKFHPYAKATNLQGIKGKIRGKILQRMRTGSYKGKNFYARISPRTREWMEGFQIHVTPVGPSQVLGALYNPRAFSGGYKAAGIFRGGTRKMVSRSIAEEVAKETTPKVVRNIDKAWQQGYKSVR